MSKLWRVSLSVIFGVLCIAAQGYGTTIPYVLKAEGKNLVLNPGFEEGLEGWKITGNPDFISIEEGTKNVKSGKRCAKISPAGDNIGIEIEDYFEDGEKIDVNNQYLVSAWIKTEKITKGTFNAVVYCYDSNRKYLKMFTYDSAGKEDKDWHIAQATIGPGGKWEFPIGTCFVNVRFSFWAEDNNCVGTAYIDDVHFGLLKEKKKAKEGIIMRLVNVVPNSGFEDDLDQWTVTGTGEECSIENVLSNVYKGRKSFRIVAKKSNPRINTPFFYPPEIELNQSYILKAWVKNGGVEEGEFHITLYCYDENNKYLSHNLLCNITAGEPPDKGKVREYLIGKGTPNEFHPGTKKIQINICFWAKESCKGEVWVDEVSLIPYVGMLAQIGDVCLQEVKRRFIPTKDGVTFQIKAKVVNAEKNSKNPKIHTAIFPLDGKPAFYEEDKTLKMDAETEEKITLVEWKMPQDILLTRYKIEISLNVDGKTDKYIEKVDVLDTLKQTCERFMQIQKPDGNFSWGFCIDIYTARTLFATSLITGDQKYKESALRFTDWLVSTQREDGGWWVGYGRHEGEDDEDVYVADNGCMALGLVAFYSYLDKERQVKYLNTVRKYISFRETWRTTPEMVGELKKKYGEDAKGIVLGGLGIGYYSHDSFADKKLDHAIKEMRSYSWTIGCSLAVLGAVYAITGEGRDKALAVQDALWLLKHESGSIRNSYSSESLVWIHKAVKDPEINRRIEQLFKSEFLPYIKGNPEWAKVSEYRNSLLSCALTYYYNYIEKSPEAKAAIMKAIWDFCSSGSEKSFEKTPYFTNPTRFYLPFASIGLLEILKPGITLGSVVK